MKRNTELLQQTMQYIKDHPERHNQGQWVCGTSACFAGWTLLLSGMMEEEVEELRGRGLGLGVHPRTGEIDWRYNGVAQKARQRLGLTMSESEKVFSEGNSSAMLELMVKDLCNGDKLRSKTAYINEAAYD